MVTRHGAAHTFGVALHSPRDLLDPNQDFGRVVHEVLIVPAMI
jgi:hypothetical protein